MEKYREGQKELPCVFADLEKAYDRVPREELRFCTRKSGVAEKYVRLLHWFSFELRVPSTRSRGKDMVCLVRSVIRFFKVLVSIQNH